jgi:bifunctional non-homologous end joining protein LigD
VNRAVVDMNGRRLSLSNLEKDLYPSYGFTKAGILDYYRRIAQFLLPHLKDRALTLKRYPEGAEREYFFEKRCPSHRPEWVQTAEVGRDDGERMTVCLVNDLETLLWAANLASLELHVPLARVHSPDTPDVLVFDLDPGEGAGTFEAARVAMMLRDLLDRMGLASMVKGSGRKGLHVYVPLNRSGATFEQTKTFSRTVALALQKHYPGLVTGQPAKTERRGKVLINWSQNDGKKTMVAVYSLRAGEQPSVSAPLAWDEVEAAVEKGDAGPLRVLHDEAVERAAQKGDLFRELLVREQRLPHL